MFQPIQRADRAGHDLWRDLRVVGCGVDLAVTQQNLNDAQIGSLLEKNSQESGSGRSAM